MDFGGEGGFFFFEFGCGGSVVRGGIVVCAGFDVKVEGGVVVGGIVHCESLC